MRRYFELAMCGIESGCLFVSLLIAFVLALLLSPLMLLGFFTENWVKRQLDELEGK